MIIATENELAIVQDIIRNFAPDCAVLVFGSRFSSGAERQPKKYSDLDLAFIPAGAALGMRRLSQLALAFSESDLPYRVDVVDYNSASPEFQTIIDSANEKIW